MYKKCFILLILLPYFVLCQRRRTLSERVPHGRDHHFSSSEELRCGNGRRAKSPCIPNRITNPCEKPFDFTHTCQLLQGRTTEYFCCEAADLSEIDLDPVNYDPMVSFSSNGTKDIRCPDGDEPTYIGCDYNSDCLDLQCSMLSNLKQRGCCRPLATIATTTTTTSTPTTTSTTPMPRTPEPGLDTLEDYLLKSFVANDYDPTVTVLGGGEQVTHDYEYDDEESLGSCPGTLDEPVGSCTLELGESLISVCKPLKNHYCVYTSTLATACCPLLIAVPDMVPLLNDDEDWQESRERRRPPLKRSRNEDNMDVDVEKDNRGAAQLDSLYPTTKLGSSKGSSGSSCPKTGYKPGQMCVPENGLTKFSIYDRFKCSRSESCTLISFMGFRCCKKRIKRRPVSKQGIEFAALEKLNRELLAGLGGHGLWGGEEESSSEVSYEFWPGKGKYGHTKFQSSPESSESSEEFGKFDIERSIIEATAAEASLKTLTGSISAVIGGKLCHCNCLPITHSCTCTSCREITHSNIQHKFSKPY